ncbi:MAG: hypothetical protein JXQ76_11145 [Campylobacterales bacterium]|nr:hypothetical protein [Campylobacterales bacterium]
MEEELEVNALVFEPIADETYEYDIEFKTLMLNIYKCYLYLIENDKRVPSNDENKIRDILLEYLKDTDIRNTICSIVGYRFDKEVDENEGRVDIKIVQYNDFENHDAFYVIECKRLDGNSKLNNAYLADGINRFTTSYKSSKYDFYYSSYYGVNGMIGFIIKEIDIDKNIHKIGNFFDRLEKDKLYQSTHDNVKLYHLMLNFSKNIYQKSKT